MVSPNKIFFNGYTVPTTISTISHEIKADEGNYFYIQDVDPELNIRAESGQSIKGVSLKKELSNSGKEAVIYTTNAVCDVDGVEYPMLAKIYRLTNPRVKAKMRLICSKSFNRKGIACPGAWLSKKPNGEECYGVIMPRVPDFMTLKDYLIKGIPFQERIRISQAIMSNFLFLHERNVQPVDFNDGNILITNKNKEVWFIDSDSYQVENFPCPVAAPTRIFDHPSRILQGFCDYSYELRKPYELAYSAAVLLFEIMMGTEPYYVGDENSFEGADNILKGRFVLHGGTNKKKKNLVIRWKQCSDSVRNLFVNIFDCDGEYFYKKNKNYNAFSLNSIAYCINQL